MSLMLARPKHKLLFCNLDFAAVTSHTLTPKPIKMQPVGAGPTSRHMQDPAGCAYSSGQRDNMTHVRRQLSRRNLCAAIRGREAAI